jgi:3-deoxy-D-manno-octulosonate 8-phosphate phosphatase (KDO 8-P phosphatase)
MLNFKQKLNNITTIVFDVEGVLTSGKLFVMENGELVNNIYSKDMYALKQALIKSFRVVLISTENNLVLKNMYSKMGIKDIFLNQKDKSAFITWYTKVHNIKEETVLFMGDDIPDIEMLGKVGLPVCPNDAAHQVKEVCQYVSDKNGGEGCVRDILEQVLRVQNKWDIAKF